LRVSTGCNQLPVAEPQLPEHLHDRVRDVAEQSLARLQLDPEAFGEQLRVEHRVALVGRVGGLVFFRDESVVQLGREEDAVLQHGHHEDHRVLDEQRRQRRGHAARLEVARHLELDKHSHRGAPDAL
jgi:hypothetical protein